MGFFHRHPSSTLVITFQKQVLCLSSSVEPSVVFGSAGKTLLTPLTAAAVSMMVEQHNLLLRLVGGNFASSLNFYIIDAPFFA